MSSRKATVLGRVADWKTVKELINRPITGMDPDQVKSLIQVCMDNMLSSDKRVSDGASAALVSIQAQVNDMQKHMTRLVVDEKKIEANERIEMRKIEASERIAVLQYVGDQTKQDLTEDDNRITSVEEAQKLMMLQDGIKPDPKIEADEGIPQEPKIETMDILENKVIDEDGN